MVPRLLSSLMATSAWTTQPNPPEAMQGPGARDRRTETERQRDGENMNDFSQPESIRKHSRKAYFYPASSNVMVNTVNLTASSNQLGGEHLGMSVSRCLGWVNGSGKAHPKSRQPLQGQGHPGLD